MRNFALNPERLVAVCNNLGDAVADPTLWPQIMDDICAAAGATGAALLQTDIRTPDIPRTASVDDFFQILFCNGMAGARHASRRSVPLLMRGQPVVTDQDIVTPEEMRRLDFYNECALPFGLPWFAGIGLQAGPALWAMVIQRTARQGPFEPHEVRALACLAPRLTETATLSKAVGQRALCGISNALHLVGRPVLALDRLGCVLDANAAAQQISTMSFLSATADWRCATNRQASRSMRLPTRCETTSDTAPLAATPIVVRRVARQPLVIRVLPVAGPARTPFLGARVLLVISDLRDRPQPQASVLAEAFGLTPAEFATCLPPRDGNFHRTCCRSAWSVAGNGSQPIEVGLYKNSDPSSERVGRSCCRDFDYCEIDIARCLRATHYLSARAASPVTLPHPERGCWAS